MNSRGRKSAVAKPRRSNKKQNRCRLHNGFAFLGFLSCLMVVFLTVNLSLQAEQMIPIASLQQQPEKLDKQPLLDILKLANAEISSQEEWDALPSWEQVTRRVGHRPRYVGLETCDRFRKSVPENLRQVAPAGMFNSGTNFLQLLLKENCKSRTPRRTPDFVGWQVNWGKHQSPRFRHANYVNHRMKNNSYVFPVVLVRDPWTWLQSMCKVRYSAHWFHVVPQHCPNFIPNHVEREWYKKPKNFVRKHYNGDPWLVDNVMEKANFTLDSKVVPVWVRYKNEIAHHESIAHMWKDWNQEYFDAKEGNTTFPRLMIRLEDLVFYPQLVIPAICTCVGGIIKDPLVLVGDTSKQGAENVHGYNKTDLRTAMISHIYTNRTNGMTAEDLNYAKNALADSPVLQTMGYPRDPTQ